MRGRQRREKQGQPAAVDRERNLKTGRSVIDYVLADVYGLRTQALQLTAAQVGAADAVFWGADRDSRGRRWD